MHLLLHSMSLIILTLVHLATQLPIQRRQVVNDDFIDRGCSDSQIAQCRAESASNCTSLVEALVGTYDLEEGVRLPYDTPYHIFSAFDLFFSGLISDIHAPSAYSRGAKLESAQVKRISRRNCEALLDRVSLSTEDTDECQWSYTCKYNPHYFPSFTVEAKLDDSLSVPHRCSNIKMSNIKFVRTTCEANPEEDHWCRCDAGRITTGYRHQS